MHVLATSIEGARAALETAIPLAKGSDSRLIVIVTQAVPNASTFEGSANANDFTMRQYRELVNDLDGEAQLRLCLCRSPQDVVTRLLPRWTDENRPLIDTSKPATTGAAAETSEFYSVGSSVRKSVWTLVRQRRGPHLSTCA